jgi:hypothetical protein
LHSPPKHPTIISELHVTGPAGTHLPRHFNST